MTAFFRSTETVLATDREGYGPVVYPVLGCHKLMIVGNRRSFCGLRHI